MPNWCNNFITLTPNENDKKSKKFNNFKKRFEIAATSNQPMCESLLSLKGAPKNYHEGGWYDYNVARFGTKWDFTIEKSCASIFTREISFSTETAWTPPIAFLVELCESYGIDAKIEFEEGGCDFAGIISISPEGIYDEVEFSSVDEYHYRTNDCFWENVTDYAHECDSWEEYSARYPFIVDKDDLDYLRELYDNAVKERENEGV